ncbi:MAG TPA: hypothetical protein PLW39_00715 [Thermoflexales bacterium]|nr:hypothetical protein [Thermoflexales bacterium]
MRTANTKEHSPAWWQLMILALLPALFNLLILAILGRTTLFSAQPSWNDSIGYWHQGLSFAHVGFGNGNYSVNEQLAKLPASNYGNYGPWYALLFGPIALVLGWAPYSIHLWNFVFLTLCFLAFLFLAQLSLRRALVVTALVVTWMPIMFYLPVGIMDGTHLAMAILIAGLFVRIKKTDGQIWVWLALAALVLISLPRPSWAPVIAVWACLVCAKPATRWPKLIGFLAMALVIGAGIFLQFQYLVAPFPNIAPAYDIIKGSGSPASIASAQINALSATISAAWAEARTGEGLAVTTFVLAGHVILAVLALLVMGIVKLVKWLRNGRDPSALAKALFSLGGALTFVAITALYMFYQGQRVMASPLLLFALFFVATEKTSKLWRILAVIMIVTNIASIQAFRRLYADYVLKEFPVSTALTPEFDRMIKAADVHYTPGAPAWCNTLMANQHLPFFKSYYFTALPAGVAFSYAHNPLGTDTVQTPLKSKYVLLYDEAKPDWQKGLNLKPLSQSAQIGGALYFNLDSGCAP